VAASASAAPRRRSESEYQRLWQETHDAKVGEGYDVNVARYLANLALIRTRSEDTGRPPFGAADYDAYY
jgi:hypothetical protein